MEVLEKTVWFLIHLIFLCNFSDRRKLEIFDANTVFVQYYTICRIRCLDLIFLDAKSIYGIYWFFRERNRQ